MDGHNFVNEGKGDEFYDSFKGRKNIRMQFMHHKQLLSQLHYVAAAARAIIELTRQQYVDADEE